MGHYFNKATIILGQSPTKATAIWKKYLNKPTLIRGEYVNKPFCLIQLDKQPRTWTKCNFFGLEYWIIFISII